MHPTTADGAFIIAVLGALGTLLQALLRFIEKRRRGDIDERRLDLEGLRDLVSDQRKELDALHKEIDDQNGRIRSMRLELDDLDEQARTLRRALADAHERERQLQREKERLMVALEAAKGGAR